MSISGQTLACLPCAFLEEPDLDASARASALLVGESAAMRRLRLQIERIGPHFRTVLVRGEMGTGKEVVARALHECGAGKEEAFVVCHASSLDEMGKRRGSASLPSLKASAAGTLFLEGAEELSPEAQLHLLRMLEQRVSARTIVATTADLRARANAGRFRQDLYHRLAMVEIAIAPLRTRVEDIALLATHFVHRFAGLYDKDVEAVAPEAIERLRRYAWPGNVREFENVLRNGVLQCEETTLRANDLSSLVELASKGKERVVEAETPARLQDVIDQHVLHVLERCSGNKVRAAEMLGISRSTLYRMLEVCSIHC